MKQQRYELSRSLTNFTPNVWDVIVFLVVVAIFAALAWGASQMAMPYKVGHPLHISLDPLSIPRYAINSVLRMFIAMTLSLLVTFTIAPLAAKNRQAEKILLPLIDIMQAVPVLGVLSITIVAFIYLFPNSLMGPECAAIFAIFTSQVWNMILSLYQSMRTLPLDLQEVAKVYHLSAWQSFWKIEVPHGLRPLIWNAMISMSAGWFFVVVSEAIEVSQQKITLPGLGSYISKAIQQENLPALFYAMLAMLLVILLYDQLLFRPLLSWAEKFNSDIDEDAVTQESWFYNLLTKTRLLKRVRLFFAWISDLFINGYKLIFKRRKRISLQATAPTMSQTKLLLWNIFLGVCIVAMCWELTIFIGEKVGLAETLHVFYLGLITTIKVVILIVLASVIWVPIGVWIGLNPRITAYAQPLIQFVSAFPANLFYPLFVILIIRYDLNHTVWTSPLMILGTQWYILFNVIGGTASIPKEIRLAVKNFGVKGSLWWRKMALPGIFPHYVTGAMAAAGGCWNASIVAEYVQWGPDTIISIGLGQYITKYTMLGDFPRIALGISVMCVYVLLFNRLLWQRLYSFAAERFTMDQ